MHAPIGLRSRTAGLLAATALFLLPGVLAAQAPEKVLISVKADTGQTAKYSNAATISITFDGETLKLESTEESEVKVSKVNLANGKIASVEFDKVITSSKTKLNGEEMPADDEKKGEEGSAFTILANGDLAAYKDKDKETDPDADKITMRLTQASLMVFSDKAVGVGDTWSHSFPGNKDWGTEKARADFKLVAFEDVGGIKTAKIEFTYAEQDAKRSIKGTGAHWVELATGDVVKSESKLENVPFDFGSGEDIVATASAESSRTSGGMLASAQTGGQAAAPATDTKPAETKPAEQKPAEDKNSIDAKMKDWEKMEGIFTIYRKVDAGRTRLNLEVKRSQLNKLMMLQTTISTGDAERVVAGNPVSDLMFELREMPNNKVYMVVPNTSWRAKGNPALSRVLDRSFSESFIEAFDIEATQKDRDSILLDISQFFTGNISRLFEALSGGGNPLAMMMGGGGGVTPDREKTFVKTLKVFPTNVYAETTFVFTGSRGGATDIFGGEVPVVPDSRSRTVGVTYNLFALPASNGYVPRRDDPRVGYFNIAYRDWSQPGEWDQTKLNILRWDLRKKDPKAAMSEPVEPITFWVDNAFPEEFRPIVSNALLSWNAAFERIGFKNAVVVKQMPEKPDFDHADMRYNVIRLVASPEDAYAVALFRANPITGQILNASITVDANFIRYVSGLEWKEFSPADSFKSARRFVDGDPKKLAAELAAKHRAQHGANCGCSFAAEAGQNAAFGNLAISLLEGPTAKERRKQFVHEYIYSVVQHEFGHILGLRHNFIATNHLSLEELGNAEKVKKHNTSASVMDYVPFNIAALGKKEVPFFGMDLGDYDYWAIRYGYMETGHANPDTEQGFLKAIAAQSGRWGLKYQTDEWADGLDPMVARFDMASDPLAYYEKQMAMAHKLLMTLKERSPKGGQSFWEFTRSFNILVNGFSRSAGDASRYLGGARRNNSFQGDANQGMPFRPVPAADQRRALRLIVNNLFDEKALDIPKEYYRMFQADPKGSFMDNLMSSMTSYPMFDRLSDLQAEALNGVLGDGVLSRLMNFDWKKLPGEDVLSVREVMDTVTAAVWKGVAEGRAATPMRRQLQRAHVDRLIDLGIRQTSGRTELNMQAWRELKKVNSLLASAKSTDADTTTHTAELLARTTNALHSIELLGSGGGGGGGISLADLLGGAKPPVGKP